MPSFDLTSIGSTLASTRRLGPAAERTEGVSFSSNSGLKGKSTVKNDSTMSFKDMLAQALDTVNNLQLNADLMAQKVATGEITDIHQVLMAVEEVNLGLQLTMQIRNKIIEAYQEIMRMQV